MATTNWDKFLLLMWKNWLLQWRHKIQTAVEIFVPVLFSALLVLIRSLVDPDTIPNPTIFNPLSVNKIPPFFNESNKDVNYQLSYSPANPQLYNLINGAASYLGLSGVVEMNNSAELERGIFDNNYIAGVEFDESYSNLDTTLPDQLVYSLRFPSELRNYSFNGNPLSLNWRTDLLFPLFQSGGPRNNESSSGGMPPGYYDESFLQIQNAIAKTFTEFKSSVGYQFPDIMLQRYPYPPYTKDILLQGLESFVSLIILLSFVYPCINLVKFITTEKEKQLKEAMKIMGLPNWLHWTAWFLKAMGFMIISISLIVVLIKIPWYPDVEVSVFTYSNWFVLWILLFIYSITTIMFCFMMSVFFSKANTAAAVTGLVWFIIYAPYSFTEQNYQLMSLTDKLLVCLFSNTAMAYGFRAILRFEGSGEGLQWDNLWTPINPDDNFPVGLTIVMLLIDAVIYLLIALYVEKINPGEFGVPEKWYFPFTRKFWCGTLEYSGISDSSHDSQTDDTIESDPLDKYAGIQIKNLRKMYSNKKVAVEGLTLNMYEDQITVLLGHNGAGKTTTMSMLTGMFPPSSGTAVINGKDIKTDIDGVRNSLGLCPQHNILFDELTVREHIIFYSRLKGLDKAEIENEITKYVNLLELQPKINAQSKTLSGGMKRKLSVGVALCGNSKVVLCDEPTSGMDPAARRALWDLLQHEKKGRTLLLSTHFMDEADILGDRIAIMSDGVLRACGTSFFLKKRFGIGYHLICVKSKNANVQGVTTLLQKYIPQISVKTNIGSELSYELSEQYIERFEDIFSDLESNSHSLGLIGYGVSPTTLEEVFMKVGTDNKEELDNVNGLNDNYQRLNGVHESEKGVMNLESTTLLHGMKLYANQVSAMFEKKFWYTLRNWLLMLIQIIIPVAFLIMTILIVRSWAGGGELPALEISLDPYLNTVTVLQREKNETDLATTKISNEYEAIFKLQIENHKIDVTTDDMSTYILKLSETLISRINSKYMIGATISKSTITAWFNNQAYHTAPLAMSTIHNAILRASDCGVKCSITVINKPIPYKTESRLKMLQAGNNMGFQLSFNTGFALSFVSAFYVLFYIKERVNRAKLLQFVSGVNVYIYWTTAFIWDYFTFIITSIFAMITLIIFQEDGYATFNEIGRVFLVWICFGYGFLPVTYLMSMLFSIPSTGFVRGAIWNIFTGIACFSIVFIMAFEGFDLKHVADGLTWFFLFFPHFALSEALSNLNIVNISQKTCSRLPSFINACTFDARCCVENFFQWEAPGIGRHIFFLLFVGTITFITLLIIELRLIETLIYKGKKIYKGILPPQTEDTELDPDVKSEKNKVSSLTRSEISDRNLVLQSMTKSYKNFVAVNQLSVTVNSYECFGLLGVNGAGKTSTFKMLTGDEKISYGEAYVKGISLKNNMNKVHQIIGYCPQFDALIEDLTGRETLRIFCLLRGVPKSNISNVSDKLANGLNFMKHIDKKVREYSGGNKRKLSTAVALIGNPAVVYLDEPTTGMDPGAKRQLWNMICKIRDTGKTIVLTSHSMEECEALCTKLAIMVNGEFKCIGSTQYLKNKFSKGYLLTIKIKKPYFGPAERFQNNSIFGKIINEITNNDESVSPINMMENIENVKKFVYDTFNSAELKEEYRGLLTYNIPSTKLKWSRMFGILQNSRGRFNIEDYSISQTSLEQVFLSFTKYQREGNLNDE